MRGTATNGFVTRNLGAVKASDAARRRERASEAGFGGDMAPAPLRVANADILAHEKKRAIEVELASIRADLEDSGKCVDDVEREVAEARVRIEKRKDSSAISGARGRQVGSSGTGADAGVSAGSRAGAGDAAADAATASRKESELARVRSAWGISSSRVPGAAFDREALAAEKAQRKKLNEERARAAQETAVADAQLGGRAVTARAGTSEALGSEAAANAAAAVPPASKKNDEGPAPISQPRGKAEAALPTSRKPRSRSRSSSAGSSYSYGSSYYSYTGSYSYYSCASLGAKACTPACRLVYRALHTKKN